MEFPFNVNELLPNDITLIDGNMAPFRGKVKLDRSAFSSKQAELKRVIDMMGEASAKAQCLKAPITSSMKLSHSDHKLYVLKDSSANSGNGALVGIIKIGYKRLFLLDIQGGQHEVNPLCVLDFYVHESRQREGYGKALFQHVIQMEGVQPHMLAIDRPSHKFLAFLAKHYKLEKTIPQVNNFVVFMEFFRDLQAVGEIQRRGQPLAGRDGLGRPPLHPYKRPSLQNNYLLQRRQNLEQGRLHGRAVSASTTHRSKSTDQQAEPNYHPLRDITLPSIVPRPPGRHSASRSRESYAGSGRWVLEESLNNGLAARATSYSRHSLSREGSGTTRKMQQEGEEKETGSAKITSTSSGGKKRTLHLTSTGNPFYVGSDPQSDQLTTVALNASQPCASSQAAQRVSSSPGSYTVSKVYDSYFGPAGSLGTTWNIFGVPPTMKNNYPGGSHQRTLPF